MDLEESSSARWCPFAVPDERLQAVSLAGPAAHDVGVDPEGQVRVGVAKLAHHMRGVIAACDEDRRERVAQLVGGDSGRQGQLAACDQQLVGALDDGAHHSLAEVVLGASATGLGREDGIVDANRLTAGVFASRTVIR